MVITYTGAHVDVFSDNDKNLKGIFFQDQQMKAYS